MPKEPLPAVVFTPGPALTPAPAALSFLDTLAAEARPRQVRVAAALSFGEGRLTIQEARLGTAADAPRVQLDDSRLGIALLDRAQALCPEGERCVVWLVGYWRGRGQLELRQVPGRAVPGATERVEIERGPAAGP